MEKELLSKKISPAEKIVLNLIESPSALDNIPEVLYQMIQQSKDRSDYHSRCMTAENILRVFRNVDNSVKHWGNIFSKPDHIE